MIASTIIFYILSFLILFFAILTVTTRMIFRAAVYLLFTLLAIAGLYFYFNYGFIGVVQIAVYAGGVVVLIIFSILLTNKVGDKLSMPGTLKIIASAAVALSGFVLCFWLISQNPFTSHSAAAIEPDIATIGEQLLSLNDFGYILPFEAISILLLAAMIGCIVIAIKLKDVKKI